MKNLSLGFLAVMTAVTIACNKDSGGGGGGGGAAAPAAPPPAAEASIVAYNNNGKADGRPVTNRQYSIYNSDKVPVDQIEMKGGKTIPVQNVTFFSHPYYLQCVGGGWKTFSLQFFANRCIQDSYLGKDSCAQRTHMNWVATTEFNFDASGNLSFYASINNIEYRANAIGYFYNGRQIEIKKFIAQSSNSSGAPYIQVSALSALNSRANNPNIKAQLVDVLNLTTRVSSVRDFGAGFRHLQPMVVEFGSNVMTREQMQRRVQDPRATQNNQNPGVYNPIAGQQPVDQRWMRGVGFDNSIDVHNIAVVAGEVLMFPREYLVERPNRYGKKNLPLPYSGRNAEYSISMDEGSDLEIEGEIRRSDRDETYAVRVRRELQERRRNRN